MDINSSGALKISPINGIFWLQVHLVFIEFFKCSNITCFSFEYSTSTCIFARKFSYYLVSSQILQFCVMFLKRHHLDNIRSRKMDMAILLLHARSHYIYEFNQQQLFYAESNKTVTAELKNIYITSNSHPENSHP